MYEEDNCSYDSTEAELDELLTPELLEFRLSNEISKRGWLHFMNMESRTWDRRFCVSHLRATLSYSILCSFLLPNCKMDYIYRPVQVDSGVRY